MDAEKVKTNSVLFTRNGNMTAPEMDTAHGLYTRGIRFFYPQVWPRRRQGMSEPVMAAALTQPYFVLVLSIYVMI